MTVISLALDNAEMFHSWADLAREYQMDSGTLQSTLLRFNHMFRNGRDEDFQRVIMRGAAPLEKPPAYTMRL